MKWEEKEELNFGIDFVMDRFSATIDIYSQTSKDFIINRIVDAAVYGFDRRFENSGKINTQGLELNLGYQVTDNYQTNINLSTYNTTLEEYVLEDGDITANLGSPGQNSTNMVLVKPGEAIGQIWTPRFDGVNADGSPNFGDVNGDLGDNDGDRDGNYNQHDDDLMS